MEAWKEDERSEPEPCPFSKVTSNCHNDEAGTIGDLLKSLAESIGCAETPVWTLNPDGGSVSVVVLEDGNSGDVLSTDAARINVSQGRPVWRCDYCFTIERVVIYDTTLDELIKGCRDAGLKTDYSEPYEVLYSDGDSWVTDKRGPWDTLEAADVAARANPDEQCWVIRCGGKIIRLGSIWDGGL